MTNHLYGRVPFKGCFGGEDKIFNRPSQTAYLVLTLHGGPVNSRHALMTFSLGKPRDPGGETLRMEGLRRAPAVFPGARFSRAL